MDLMLEAEKKLKTSWFLGGPKVEDAAELYTQAANKFKMNKQWEEAAKAFIECANCNNKLKNQYEEATNYVSAAVCYRKISAKEAVEYLKKAVEIYANLGRFNIAAKHQKEIAEIYETEIVDLENACQAYQLAADWYAGEESKSSAQTCLLKVALFSAQLDHFDKAIEIYEQVAAASLEVSLLKWSVKDYFFRAGLCHLCSGDSVATQRAISRYQEMDVSFSSTRECQFLKDIVADYESGDVDSFTQHVAEYDSFTRLDNWKTSILLRIKKSIKTESVV